MDLGQLLLFAPLLIAGAWLGYLIFRKDLASETLGKIISYFIGIVIILFAVKFFVTDMIIPWTNDILQESQSNTELIEFINSSEDIVTSSFNGEDVISTASQAVESAVEPASEIDILPTEVPAPAIEATAVPSTSSLVNPQPATTIHTVEAGENLFAISQMYGTDVQTLSDINNLNSCTIIPGQELIIPQSNS